MSNCTTSKNNKSKPNGKIRRKRKKLSDPIIKEVIEQMSTNFNENGTNSDENDKELVIKEEIIEIKQENIDSAPPDESDLILSPNIKRNAFDLMMESRRKVIGRNSPGKEAKSEEAVDELEKKITKISRKCFLENWAEMKGASKRKRIYEETTTVINKKLEQRAKKLKKMLKIDDTITIENENITITENETLETDSDSEDIRNEDENCSKNNMQAERTLNTKDVKAWKMKIKLSMRKGDEEAAMKFQEVQGKISENDIDSNQKYKQLRQSPQELPIKSEEKLFIVENLDLEQPKQHTTTPENPKNRSLDNKKDKQLIQTPLKFPIKNEENMAIVPIKEESDEKFVEQPKKPSTLNIPKKIDAENQNMPIEEVGKSCEKTAEKFGSSTNLNSENEKTLIMPEIDKKSKKSKRQPKGRLKDNKVPVQKLESIDRAIDDQIKMDRKSPIMGIENCGRTLRPRRSKLVIVDSPEKVDNKKKTNKRESEKKLAPIFIPRPKIDPKLVEAKREFLLSGLPSSLKNDILKQKIADEIEYDVFPTISHVQQKNNHSFWKLSKNIILPLMNQSNEDKEIITNQSNFEFEILNNSLEIQPEIQLDRIKNCKNIIKYIKAQNLNYPVFKIFKSLYQRLALNNKDDGKKKRRSKAKVVEKPEELLWTEKYKPQNSEEIWGNQVAVSSLRNWLANFSKKSLNCSDSDFETTTDDSRDSFKAAKNTIILYGPNGCGKTCAIYAICNELNYNILEVNAASRRTGKRLLQEMQEATKSHQVKKNSLINFIASTTPNTIEEQEQKEKKMCALLIEDIDLVFEQDDGFYTALNQISLTSKRPIILTTTDYKALSEQKFLMQYQVIRFSPLSSSIIGPWLQILCVIEGIYIDLYSIQNLLDNNRGDLRKTILELQFWVNSGGQFGEKSILNLRDIPQNIDDIELNIISKSEDENYSIHSDCDKFYETSHNLDKLWRQLPNIFDYSKKHVTSATAKLFNCLTFSDNFHETESNFSVWKTDLKDSLSLNTTNEYYKDYEFNLNLSLDLSSGIFKQYQKLYNKDVQIIHKKRPEQNKWRKKAKSCTENFQKACPLTATSDRKSLILDYLPLLRNMARSEMKRAVNNTKRGNRFYNYLNGLGINCNESTYKFACDIFHLEEV